MPKLMMYAGDDIPALAEFAQSQINATYFSSPKSEIILGKFVRKRAFDFVFAALTAAIILVWVVPLIALLIKLDSKGPIFFRQQRTGKNGKPFSMIKFRSMAFNTDAHTVQAQQGDKRITRVGAFLRKTSLDELPQFFNVLMGEMSVVGPRPHMLHHTAEYSKVIKYFMQRHQIAPGITGLAQISGHRGETKEVDAMVKRVNTDIFYIHNWSFLLDMKIVVSTVWHVFYKNENVF